MAERLSPHVTLHVIKEENIRALDEDQLEKLYCWIDRIPFSRPKRNVTRDFSDGGERLTYGRKILFAYACPMLYC